MANHDKIMDMANHLQVEWLTSQRAIMPPTPPAQPTSTMVTKDTSVGGHSDGMSHDDTRSRPPVLNGRAGGSRHNAGSLDQIPAQHTQSETQPLQPQPQQSQPEPQPQPQPQPSPAGVVNGTDVSRDDQVLALLQQHIDELTVCMAESEAVMTRKVRRFRALLCFTLPCPVLSCPVHSQHPRAEPLCYFQLPVTCSTPHPFYPLPSNHHHLTHFYKRIVV